MVTTGRRHPSLGLHAACGPWNKAGLQTLFLSCGSLKAQNGKQTDLELAGVNYSCLGSPRDKGAWRPWGRRVGHDLAIKQ